MSREEYPGEYVTLTEEMVRFVRESTFTVLTYLHPAAKELKRLGVSVEDLFRNKDSIPADRTVQRFRLVPSVFTEEELLGDCGVLRRLANERGVSWVKVQRTRRRYAKRRRSRTTHGKGDVHNTPTSPSESIEGYSNSPPSDVAEVQSWQSTSVPLALETICAANPSAPSHTLRLLAEVQREAAVPSQPHQVPHPSLTARFERVPLPVLRRCAEQLHTARETWASQVMQPLARQLQNIADELSLRQMNAVLFNICLWQRWHPLGLLTEVLELYRLHAEHFRGGEDNHQSVVEAIHDLLECMTQDQYPWLAEIPWLIRCDVLMTYPHQDVMEQRRLMTVTARAVLHRARSTFCDDEEMKRKVTLDASMMPTSPHDLLRGYLVPEVIPDRFTAELPLETYRVLRDAFQQHKEDGVKRLSGGLYGVCVRVNGQREREQET